MADYCQICGKKINTDYDWENICRNCEEVGKQTWMK